MNIVVLNFANCGFTYQIGNIFGLTIGKQHQLQELCLNDNCLENDVGICIFENIKNNCHSIIILNISNCGFTSKIGNSIGDAIGQQKRLKELDFSNNLLDDDIGKNIFWNIEKRCKNILHLNFESCGFTHEIGNIVGNAIGQQKNIIKINGADNLLGDKVGKNIFYNIKQNCNELATLKFYNCDFTSKIGNNIGDAIGQQKNIQLIHLNENHFGDDVGKNIFLNISNHCYNILSLNLSTCKFTDQIGNVLIIAISQQTNLQELLLSENQFGDTLIENLLKNIRINCNNISELNVGDCGFSSAIANSVIEFFCGQNFLEELCIYTIIYDFHISKEMLVNIEKKCKHLSTICFGKCEFTSEEAGIISDIIINQQDKLKQLYLWDNEFGDEGWKYILSHLENNCPNISILDLGNCGITSDIGNILGVMIGRKKYLKELNLWNNNIEDVVGKILFYNIKETHHNLTFINIENCGITPNIGNILGDAIGQQYYLQRLDISNNYLGDYVGKNIFQNISNNCRNIRKINFNDCGFTSEIGDILGDAIGQQKYLNELYIFNNNLGNFVGRHLFYNIKKYCQYIKCLDLSNCRFTSQIGNTLGDAIGQQTNLRSLFLSENNLRDSIGANIFSNIKLKCKKISELEYYNCGFTSKIDDIIGNAIGQLTYLKSISSSDNALTDYVGSCIFQSIQQICFQIVFLKFENCKFTSKIGYSFSNGIGQQTNLDVLHISGNRFGDDIGKNLFEKLYQNCQKLTYLAIKNCGFTCKIGNFLGNMIGRQKDLKVLDISDNNFGDDIGRVIFKNLNENCTKLCNLKCSNCGFTYRIGNIIGDAIGKQCSLITLSIKDNKLGDIVGKNIFSSMISECLNLEFLNVRNCDFTSNLSYIIGDAIANFTELKVLSLCNNQLCSVIGRYIFKNIQKNCRKIEIIDCNNCGFTSEIGNVVGYAIAEQANLRMLSLYNNSLGNDVGRCIFENVEMNCCMIENFNFRNCNFTSEIGRVIGNAISKQGNNLKDLCLANNPLGDNLGKYIFERIKESCCNILNLNIANCGLTSNIGDIVGKFIGQQTRIRRLSFSQNSFGNNVGKSIFENLKRKCNRLTFLHFESCNFTFHIGDCIGDAVGKQRGLEYLYFSENFLQDDVGKNIFENIKENCFNISVLKFANCGFSPLIGNILGDAIGQQRALKELIFSNNQIGDDIGFNLFYNLQQNCSCIVILKFESCGFTPNIGNVIGEMIGQQSQLKILCFSNNQFGNDVGKGIFQNIRKNCHQISELFCNLCGINSKIGNSIYDAIFFQKKLKTFHIWNIQFRQMDISCLSENIKIRNRLG
ncbi:unnamed protein product [Dimorphilus gyrociliatus]|uniref:Uncharacterized protein n=1 Tax=Dimorphilus gyrociliatus TaxID=2664684 RepID=A0A7I8WFE4_9ANNE|nr:unnamed protein product [Dimorphilus gyrociliatus]